jgi:hypothetical protein
MPTETVQWPLIGKRFSDEAIAPLLRSREKPDIEPFAGMRILGYAKNGIDVYTDEAGIIVSLLFFGNKLDERERYQGPLPHGLGFADSKQEVIARFGEPSRVGKEKSTGAPWVRYDFPDYSLHLRFSSDGNAIEQIGLMSAALARGEL